MKKTITFLLILLCVCQLSYSQTLKNRVSNLKTSWLGNSFGGGQKWVQSNIDQMIVSRDGTLHAWTAYDEAGREFGVYKGVQRENGTWYGDVIGNDYVAGNGGTAIVSGTQWYIEGYVNFNGIDNGRTRRQGTTVKRNGTSIVLKFDKATSLGVDYKNNYLMVTDDGPKKHLVMFYDTLGNLKKTVGIPGGIWPSQVGGNKALDGVLDNDLKFYYLSGCGADTVGNIYVSMTEPYSSSGAWIRCFNPKGDSLLWELHSHFFCDNTSFDKAKDGTEIYSQLRKYKMDYSREPGQQDKLVAFTFNPYLNNGDKRFSSGAGNALMRRINGKKFLFLCGMGSTGFDIYKFDSLNHGEVAIPTGIRISGGNYQSSVILDSTGNFWTANHTNIILQKVTGIDANANPVYGLPQSFSKPPLFDDVMDCWYAGGAKDVMYVGGFKPGETDKNGWMQVGRVLARYDNWFTNPTLIWHNDSLPFYHHNTLPVGGRIAADDIFVAGDYVFIDYGIFNTPNPESNTPAPYNIYNVSDGKFVGEIFAGPEVHNQSSWHDLTVSYDVMQRSNKEYIIISEENWKAKNLIYRWCPTGDCGDFFYPNVSAYTSKKYAIKDGQIPAEIVFLRNNTSLDQALTVDYTLSGTASAADFTTPLNGKITFEPGKDTARLILIPALTANNNTRKLVLSLTESKNYWLAQDSSVTSVFMFGHTKAVVTIKTLADTILVNGSDSAKFIVTRDNGIGNLFINLSKSGTAVSNIDYYAVKNPLFMPEGALVDSFYVKSIPDIVFKDNKSLTFTIPNDTNYIVFANNSASLVIKGNRIISTDSSGVLTIYNAADSVKIDGEFNEKCWQFKNEITKENDGFRRNTAYFASTWDTTYLYVGVIVKDAKVVVDNASPWENDAIEIYLDGDNHKGNAFNKYGVQYIAVAGDLLPLGVYNSTPPKSMNIKRKSKIIDGGYTLEMAIPWYILGKPDMLQTGTKIGFDVLVEDNNGSGRDNSFCWNGDGNDFQSNAKYGTLILNDSLGWGPHVPYVIPGLPVVSITTKSNKIVEGTADMANVVIARDNSVGPLTVNYTISGTVSANDYTPQLTGSVVIPNGSKSVAFNIQAIKDTMAEGTETLILALTQSSLYAFGNSFQVMINISDSANGSTQNTIPQDGLKVWLRADNGVILNGSKVSTWLDNAGGDNNATQPAAGLQPTLVPYVANGYPAVQFKGTGDNLKFNFPVNGLTNMSIFTVTYDRTGRLDVWGQYAPIGWGESGGWGILFLAADNTKVAWRFGTGEASNTNLNSNTPSDTSKFVIANAIMDKANDYIYVNGLLIGSKTKVKDTIANCADYCSLGIGGNSTSFKGMIAEVIVYDVSLDAVNRSKVEAYLIHKYLDVFDAIAEIPVSMPPFTIYPNPADGESVYLKGLSGLNHISIYTITGKLIYKTVVNASDVVKLGSLNLPQGVYIISAQNANGIRTGKLLVH